MYRRHFLTAGMILARSLARPAAEAAPQLTISWEKNCITISALVVWRPVT